MSKIAVVYWSSTGNTEIMAEEIAGKIKDMGHEVSVIFSDQFSKDQIKEFDGFAFGCPAMGDEQLEEDSFEPMFADVEKNLSDKPVVLFGSYEWAEGEWMKTWYDRCKASGINLVADGLAVFSTPEDDDKQSCKKLAEDLINSLQ